MVEELPDIIWRSYCGTEAANLRVSFISVEGPEFVDSDIGSVGEFFAGLDEDAGKDIGVDMPRSTSGRV